MRFFPVPEIRWENFMVVEAIRESGRHEWISEFEKKYGLA